MDDSNIKLDFKFAGTVLVIGLLWLVFIFFLSQTILEKNKAEKIQPIERNFYNNRNRSDGDLNSGGQSETSTSQEDLYGIGINIEKGIPFEQSPEVFYITYVRPNSAVATVGLQKLDIIKLIDDHNVTENDTMEDVSALLTGEKNSLVRVRIYRSPYYSNKSGYFDYMFKREYLINN